jgi:hypothetical protein
MASFGRSFSVGKNDLNTLVSLQCLVCQFPRETSLQQMIVMIVCFYYSLLFMWVKAFATSSGQELMVARQHMQEARDSISLSGG